jgi:hypothetical protein
VLQPPAFQSVSEVLPLVAPQLSVHLRELRPEHGGSAIVALDHSSQREHRPRVERSVVAHELPDVRHRHLRVLVLSEDVLDVDQPLHEGTYLPRGDR